MKMNLRLLRARERTEIASFHCSKGSENKLCLNVLSAQQKATHSQIPSDYPSCTKPPTAKVWAKGPDATTGATHNLRPPWWIVLTLSSSRAAEDQLELPPALSGCLFTLHHTWYAPNPIISPLRRFTLPFTEFNLAIVFVTRPEIWNIVDVLLLP